MTGVTRKQAEHIVHKILPTCSSVQAATVLVARYLGRTRVGPSGLLHMLHRYGFKTPSCYLAKPAPELAAIPEDPAERSREILLRDAQRRIKRLEVDLKKAIDEGHVGHVVREILQGAISMQTYSPKWTLEHKRVGSGKHHGVPTLTISDVHYGEVVQPDQVHGVNIYNKEVAERRIQRVFKQFIALVDNVFTPCSYPGAVVQLGGDLVNGNIHEELRETNHGPIFQCVLELTDLLAAGITLVKQRFGKVFVPCVVGNHGRLDRKPRMKYGPQDNFEYILYHMLASRFKGDPDVEIMVSPAFTASYQVYGTRVLLMHGDSFRGGSGISGPLLPWTLGDTRMRKQRASMEAWTKKSLEYDVLVFGHWHTYFPGKRFKANGSLIGHNEYAQKMGFDFEPPLQAFFFTSPEWGVTFDAPIYGEEPEGQGCSDSSDNNTTNSSASWLQTR